MASGARPAFGVVLGLGGSRSADYPFRRAHVGRAFVEHVAEFNGFPPWRPVSGALADLTEHPSGIILCRLWAPTTRSGNANASAAAAAAARQCMRYLDVRSPGRVALTHGQTWLQCGRFTVVEGVNEHRVPPWARGVAGALAIPEQTAPSTGSRGRRGPDRNGANEQLLRLHIGVGSPLARGQGSRDDLDHFGEAQLPALEAVAVLESAFPAAYEWLQKRWLGASAITEGAIFRKSLVHDFKKRTYALPPERSPVKERSNFRRG